MKLSHSKLNTIIDNPATYFLNYKMKIVPKIENPALVIGSAVHWGIENNTEDLTEYFKENGTPRQKSKYSDEQALAEAMVHGYLINKDDIFKNILQGDELLDEEHELSMEGELQSFKFENHKFIGIIDLLLVTNKGLIIIDYKTSSREPNWDDYIDQIYRYIHLSSVIFPGVPVYRIGIINLKKVKLGRKTGENDYSYRKRLFTEYEINDDKSINYHIYEPEKLDKEHFKRYIHNLSIEADLAQSIEDNQLWYINYANAITKYGKSQYYDIFYQTPMCHMLYTIQDSYWDPTTKEVKKHQRDCVKIDMLVLDSNNILNKYEQFEVQALGFYSIYNDMEKNKLFDHLKKNFITDDSLLETYWDILCKKVENDLLKGGE